MPRDPQYVALLRSVISIPRCWLAIQKPEGVCVNLHLPGEAALAVATCLLGRQHEGIGPAGKQQVPDLEGFADPEPSTSPRAIEPLQPLDAARHD